MNEQTAKSFGQLADKLGTTSEHLWGILLKQAPIDATVTLLQTIFLFLIGWTLWIIHKKLLSKPSGQERHDSYYEMYGGAAVLPMALAIFVWVIMMIICICCFDSIVSGYFHPEHWALKEAINILHNCN